jgi:hypothetical protein
MKNSSLETSLSCIKLQGKAYTRINMILYCYEINQYRTNKNFHIHKRHEMLSLCILGQISSTFLLMNCNSKMKLIKPPQSTLNVTQYPIDLFSVYRLIPKLLPTASWSSKGAIDHLRTPLNLSFTTRISSSRSHPIVSPRHKYFDFIF